METKLEKLGYKALCMTPEGKNVVFTKKHKHVTITIDISHGHVDRSITPPPYEITKWSEIDALAEALNIATKDVEELENE